MDEIAIKLTRAEADELRDLLSRYEDKGPPGMGWQSPELEALAEKITCQIAVPDPVETAKLAGAKIAAHDFKRIARALGLPASEETTIDEMVSRIEAARVDQAEIVQALRDLLEASANLANTGQKNLLLFDAVRVEGILSRYSK